MLNLKSFYRSIQDRGVQLQSAKSSKQQNITAGICDYIPQNYFNRQYFSIYIEGMDVNEIIQTILWNQYYEKTLLKEIYTQFTTTHTKNQHTLISRLDMMISKVASNDVVYLKVQNKVYNLRDKLQYGISSEMERQIKQAQTIIIEKITQEGKWKKVSIDFGPYKMKNQYDIVFSYVPPTSQIQSMAKSNDFIEENERIHTNTESKQTTKKISTKITTQSEKKPSKTSVNSTTKKLQAQKSESIHGSTVRSRSKSKIQNANIVPKSHKKSETMKQIGRKSEKKKGNGRENNLLEVQNVFKSMQNSQQKVINLSEYAPNHFAALQQTNLNSTVKLNPNSLQNSNQEQYAKQPISLDLKRKNILKIKQNSLLEQDRVFAAELQNAKVLADQAKNNSILSQILSKKEEIIYSQKKRIQELERKHEKQIQELRLQHFKENQSFKTQISHILNEYSLKYENQKQESKKLRSQIAIIQQAITDNKVLIAELQIKSKFNEEQGLKFKKQSEYYKQKMEQIQQKYHNLVNTSKQQMSKLVNERNQYQNSAEKNLQKYRNLSKKLKLLMQQQQNSNN